MSKLNNIRSILYATMKIAWPIRQFFKFTRPYTPSD